MIDLHAHILPGIDDGPQCSEDAITMARLAVAEGITSVACTSHRNSRRPNRAEQILDGIAALQPEIDAAGLALRLLHGLEIALDQVAGMDDAELRAATLGDGDWLLLEPPFRGWPLDLPDILTALEVRGFRALLAHPERNASVQNSPDRLRDAVGRGALVQVNAGSITGELGAAPQRAANALLRAGLVHVIASDMHSPTARPPGLLAAVAAAATHLRVSPGALAWMVRDVPHAIVTGADVRPPQTRR